MRGLPLTLVALLDVLGARGARLALSGRTAVEPQLHPRAAVSGTTNGTIPVRDSANTFYTANITLGGANKVVMLDTGSSDLWVTGNVQNAQDSGKAAKLSYAVGQAAGDIHFATLQFDNYTVDNQAFLWVQDTSTFSANITAQGYDGLIGLGPNTGSVILDTLDKGAAGDTPLNRIFSQNTSTSNYITLLLDRSSDPGESFAGQMTISELVPQFANISSQPKLDVMEVRKLTQRDQHWEVMLDKDGIIGPDGNVIPYETIVHGTDGRLVAVLDSGFTFPQVPRSVSDAIYGRVPGAEYDTKSQMWLIPCDIEVNLTFVFGGIKFPVHPLDTSDDNFNTVDSSGNHVCLGSFQPISTAFSLLGEYDMILGMSFIRNAYTLFDFGDFVDDVSSDTGSPFVQLLSLTDPAAAHADFVKVRLNGVDTSGDAAHALLPAAQGQHSPETDAEKKAQLEGKVLRQWPYILLGGLALLAIIAGLIVWRCCCRGRRARKLHAQAGAMPMVGTGARGQRYQSLSEPPPAAHGYAGYQDPYYKA